MNTPAAELARLKREYPLWSFRRAPDGSYVAHRHVADGVIRFDAPTLAELEAKLRPSHGGPR